VFGDDGIDDSVNTNRRNLESWQSNVRAASDVFESLQALVSVLQDLAAFRTDSLLENLSNLADGMRANFKNIDVIRRVDKDCWAAARTLEYHVETNTEYTSRDDALRHVIKLLHTANKTIDEDNTVKSLKEAIEQTLVDKLGAAKAEELHQEKKFLAVPEDMDF
jgi:Arc/MetJ-type ribon-helix-helix transcriptional regulator